jgi:nonsense-mediated mRNA decay protein 3
VEWESKELMSLILKKIQGLSRVKLVDASFVYTEPHSKRVKVRLTVQKEVMNGAILQQGMIVTFTVRNKQCEDCAAEYTNGVWKSVVQVRQRVDHKRTLLYLEQLILKHQAHSRCINVESYRDGLDFYFVEKNHAVRFVDFLEATIPCRSRESKRLISADDHSNIYNYKYSHFVEIIPICREDLVVLDRQIAQREGNISDLCLVSKVTSMIHFVDVTSCQVCEIDATKYWKHPDCTVLLTSRQLVPFIVLSVEAAIVPHRKFVLDRWRTGFLSKFRLVEVIVMRESEMESSSDPQQFTCLSHLGHVLHEGDRVMGYDLTTSHFTGLNDERIAQMESGRGGGSMPEVVLVRKTYSGERSKKIFTMNTFEVDAVGQDQFGTGGGSLAVEAEDEKQSSSKKKKKGGLLSSRVQRMLEEEEKDQDIFMSQVEGDRELRMQMDVFPAPSMLDRRSARLRSRGKQQEEDDEDADEDLNDDQRVTLQELMDAMRMDYEEEEEEGVSGVYDPSQAPQVSEELDYEGEEETGRFVYSPPEKSMK